MTPIQRLLEMYRALRSLDRPADFHDLMLQHAQQVEKALTPKPKKAKAPKP